MKLIVGLGNPGPKYETTRHNAGFLVLDMLVDKNGLTPVGNKFSGELFKGRAFGCDVIAIKPMTFMNLSGKSVSQVCNFYKIKPADIIVVFDDIDMEPGKIRFRAGGGHGGHNGIRSIIDCLGTKDFARLKIGVGRPSGQMDVSSWVLGRFDEAELSSFSDEMLKDIQTRTENFFKGAAS